MFAPDLPFEDLNVRAISHYALPEKFIAPVAAARHFLEVIPELRSPFVQVNQRELLESVTLWNECMPGIDPYYARKVQGHPRILRALTEAGCGLDVAGAGEINQCRDLNISLARSVVSNPVRDDCDIEAIVQAKPEYIVIHGLMGLQKLARAGIPSEHYKPKLLVRVEVPGSSLNKYGARTAIPCPSSSQPGKSTFRLSPEVVCGILQEAIQIERQHGYCFAGFGLAAHGGADNPNAGDWNSFLLDFKNTALYCREHGIILSHFDIGGGYLSLSTAAAANTTQRAHLKQINSYCMEFKAALSPYIQNVRIFAEPGRILVSKGFHSVVKILEPQIVDWKQVGRLTYALVEEMVHYGNSGTYSLFGNGPIEGKKYAPGIFSRDPNRLFDTPSVPGFLWGGTCDAYDKLSYEERFLLPRNLEDGDLLIFDEMGAYTTETLSRFNLTAPHTLVYFDCDADGAIMFWEHYSLDGQLLASWKASSDLAPLALPSPYE